MWIKSKSAKGANPEVLLESSVSVAALLRGTQSCVPDILEWEVKWALGNITTDKACGGGGIPVELFQILKDDAVKVLHAICQQIWKTQQWPQGWKKSVFVPIPKKGHAKECSNYHTIASKWKSQSCLTLYNPMKYTVLGILQARILDWVAFPFSGGSSNPRNWTQISCITGRFFTSWAIRELMLAK